VKRDTLREPLLPGSRGGEAAGPLTGSSRLALGPGLHLPVCRPAHPRAELVGKKFKPQEPFYFSAS